MSVTTAPAIDFSRCVNLIEVASGPDEWRFGLHPDHVAMGWTWRALQMRKAGELGCKNHILHMPLGRLIGVGTFTFDMASQLMAAGGRYAALVPGFARDLAPLVRDGHRVEVYLGCLQSSPGMTGLKGQGLRDDYLRKLATNLKPFLDLGCPRIWFDASALIRPGDAELGVLQWLRGTGVEVGIEAWPVQAEHLAGFPVFAVEQDYQAQRAYPGAMDRQRAGRIVRSVNHTPAELKAATVAAILADGDLPAIDIVNLQ